MKSPDQSGFSCDGRFGTFADPLFCNIFHECEADVKRSFVCGAASLFDAKTGKCVTGADKCEGLIYEEEFLYVPAVKDLPVGSGKACSTQGVFRAVDNEKKNYCDLFYLCNKINETPIYFYCDIEFLSKKAALCNLGPARLVRV